MTETEIAAVVRGIAPVIRDAIAAGVQAYGARLSALETKQIPAARDGVDGAPGPAGYDGVPGPEGPRGPDGPAGPPGRDGRDGLPGIAGVPGEKGMDGAPGAAGLHGKDGTLEQLAARFDGERTVTLCFKDGTPIEGGVITFPIVLHRGVYQEGKAYTPGDSVTWAGSTWIAKETTTTKPGEVLGAAHWVLSVKRGRDGKDGRDAPGALPVVKVR